MRKTDYKIREIEKLRNTLNPSTNKNYSLRDVAEQLGYKSHVPMASWLRKHFKEECTKPAKYKYVKKDNKERKGGGTK
tara:strand:- start:378 stop:611 length:234 start_codon:yes stop_codon:yes gene_type:complete